MNIKNITNKKIDYLKLFDEMRSPTIDRIDMIDCEYDSTLTLFKDTVISRCNFNGIIAGEFKDDERKHYLRIAGGKYGMINTFHDCRFICNHYHEILMDHEEGLDTEIGTLVIEGFAHIHNTKINKLECSFDSSILIEQDSEIEKATVKGTLHLINIPFDHIELFPGGRLSIEGIDDPKQVNVTGTARPPHIERTVDAFWFYG